MEKNNDYATVLKRAKEEMSHMPDDYLCKWIRGTDIKRIIGRIIPEVAPTEEEEKKIDLDDKLVEKACLISARAHEGQRDKGGHPYFEHPRRVSDNCITANERIVAYLHDVLEDTDVTVDDLKKAGFNETVIQAVLAITRKKNETYADFIERVNENEIARKVKIHDLEDNMDITRLSHFTETDANRLKKYYHSWCFLNGLEENTMSLRPWAWDPKGRRGRMGGVPSYISEKAVEFADLMEGPYDKDDVITGYEYGYMEATKKLNELIALLDSLDVDGLPKLRRSLQRHLK